MLHVHGQSLKFKLYFFTNNNYTIQTFQNTNFQKKIKKNECFFLQKNYITNDKFLILAELS